MLKKALIALAFLLPVMGASLPASAQSTASQVVPGYWTTSGCPGGNTPCFIQYGSAIPSTSGPVGGASTDISGTVAAGGVYQTVAAASTSRKNCTIQNPTSATEALLVKFGTMSQAYSLAAGQAISALNGTVVATDAITVTAATTSHAFAGTCQ